MDGVEDAALFAMLGIDPATGLSLGADLIKQLVTDGTHRVEDPALMESVRRQVSQSDCVLKAMCIC